MQDKFWMVRLFQNSREVAFALQQNTALPPLILKNGMKICHGVEAESEGDRHKLKSLNKLLIALVQEIFHDRVYTQDNFYVPDSSHVVIDIGAHIGLFALYCQSQAKGIKVHCFEPVKSCCAYLEQSIIANQLQYAIKIHPYAVLERSTSLPIKLSQNTSASFYEEYFLLYGDGVDRDILQITGQHKGDETVPCLSLADALQLAQVDQVDLLKIHVEGTEVEIILNTPAEVWQTIDRVALIYHDFIRPGYAALLQTTLANVGFSNIVFEPHCVPRVWVIRAAKVL